MLSPPWCYPEGNIRNTSDRATTARGGTQRRKRSEVPRFIARVKEECHDDRR